MKIKVNEKPFLENGEHTVTITEVRDGTSENKGIPFFNCRFENEEGFVNQRFYQSEPGMPIIASLLRAVGLDIKEGQSFDTKQLLHKQISIEVSERHYEDPDTGKQKTIKSASHFRKAGEAHTSTTNKEQK